MIVSYDSIEDMFNALDKGVKKEQEYYNAAPEWKKALKHGDYFVSFKPDFNVWVVGKVIEKTEFEEDDESIKESRKNGFVFAMCYSVFCEEGEYGDVASSVIHRKIDDKKFMELRASKWVVGPGDSFVWIADIVGGNEV